MDSLQMSILILMFIQLTCIAAVELSPDGVNVCCEVISPSDYFCCEGWTRGNSPDCITPICSIPCGEHGTCTSPEVCTCQPGYVGEICDTESNTMYDARLLYGKEPHEGLIQVRSEAGIWSYIHPDAWSRNNSHVLCQQLGYSFAYILSDGNWANNLEISFSFLDIGFACSGNEDTLRDCDLVQIDEEISDHRMVFIECYVQDTKNWCSANCDQETVALYGYGCKCDSQCKSFGDCCPNYFTNDSCPPEVNVSVEETCSPVPFHHILTHPERFGAGYFLITDCSTFRVHDDIAKLCEHQSDINDPFTFTPVQERNSTGPVKKVYKNIFCAICNMKSLHELQAWDIILEDTSLRGLVIHDIIPPNGEAVPRTCLRNFESRSTCHNYHRYVKSSCENDYAPRYIQEKGYQNIYCAVCDDVYPQHEYLVNLKLPFRMFEGECIREFGSGGSVVSGGGFFPQETPNLITIFDLGNDGNVRNQCSEGEMYDYFSQSCRLLSCSFGFALSNGNCTAVERMHVQPKVMFENNHTVKCIYNALTEYFKKSGNLGLSIFDIMGNSDTVVVHANSSSFPQLAISLNKMFLTEYLNNSKTRNLCNASSLLLVHELEDIYATDEFQSKNDSIVTSCIHRNKILGCVSNISNDVSNPEISMDIKSYKFTWKNEINCYVIEISWDVCFHTSFSCAEIALAQEEFEIYIKTNSSTVLHKASGKELSSDEFRFGENGTLYVCGSVFYPTEHESSILDAVLPYVTYVCFLFSLVATFMTFISYCIFRELRNVNGYTVINLSIAFFVAQLEFLLSPHLLQPLELCLTSAIIGHFFWLSGFFWMNALSFVTLSNLSRKTLVRETTMEMCRLIRYMAYAWGSPLLIVAVCISIHFCDCTSIAPIYGLKGASLCWLIGHDGYANLWGFAGPIFALLLTNIHMFIHAIAVLRSKMTSTRRSFKKMKEEIAIYVKLTSLMGLPWMLGFVLTFVPKVYFGNAYIYLNYIYTILNSLQGFFIFWVLVLTGRAGKLWHRKLCGSRRLWGTRGQSSRPTTKSSGKITSTSFTFPSARSQESSSMVNEN